MMGNSQSSTTGDSNILPLRAMWGRFTTPSPRPTIPWVILIVSAFMLPVAAYPQPQNPCRQSLTYRIGSVDPRFGLSSRDASRAVNDAASVWNRASGRVLFRETQKGDIVVNLVYDYRQEAADRLKGISGEIDSTKSSYDRLNAQFKNLESEYKKKQAALSTDIDSYNERIRDFNARNSAAASRKGGVPEDVYRKLKKEKKSLDAEYEDLQARQTELNRMVDTLNSMVVVINGIAADLNLNVAQYNRTGERLGGEFSEGFYEMRNGRETITIYHFTSRARLVRVLAHELGHAMGIGHNSNPKSLMYRLNNSDTLELAPEDIAALRARCK